MTELLSTDINETARRARLAASQIARFSKQKRTGALLAMAEELERNQALILNANELDMKMATILVEEGEMPSAYLNRLKLDSEKLRGVIAGIRKVAELPDQLGDSTLHRELDEGLELFRVNCPIGVVLVIFESRPDALPQIMSLLVKSGNAGLIKGGREAENSNKILFNCLQKALLSAGFPEASFSLLSGRAEVSALLKLERLIDLVIPRGSNQLVSQIQNNTHIPVLGHAEGICHLYVDQTADLAVATKLTLDAKIQYPAACNAIETLLVHRSIAENFLKDVIPKLLAESVDVRVEQALIDRYALTGVATANDTDWSTEYSDLTLSIKMVDSLGEAIEHINTYGSGHTETIVTKSGETFDRFFAEVNSAGVYWNASTRFADGFRYGFGAEVGISTGKMHPRGPVGVEGITTYKYKLIGQGQTVGEYSGPDAKLFTHKDID